MNREMRCVKCNSKLAEIDLQVGAISIKCNKNLGKGKGACNTMNVIKAQPHRRFPQMEKNAI